MKVWKIYNKEDIRFEEMASQSVEENEVKVKLISSSLSHSDLMLYMGALPIENESIIIGSQGVGMVTEVGKNVVNVERGDRVVMSSYETCGNCSPCKTSHNGDCESVVRRGIDIDGFMRDFVVVNSDSVCKLPERIKDDEAIFLNHIALASSIVSRLELEKGEHLVIIGAGVLGIALAQVAMYHQAVPIVIDSRKDNLEIAESLGIYYCINSVEEDIQKKVLALTGGRMAETLCFCTATSGSLARAIELVAKNGRMVISGAECDSAELTASFDTIFRHQLSVYGVNNGAKGIQSAINLLANGAVKVDSLVSRVVPFESTGEIVAEVCEHPYKYLKVVVKI